LLKELQDFSMALRFENRIIPTVLLGEQL